MYVHTYTTLILLSTYSDLPVGPFILHIHIYCMQTTFNYTRSPLSILAHVICPKLPPVLLLLFYSIYTSSVVVKIYYPVLVYVQVHFSCVLPTASTLSFLKFEYLMYVPHSTFLHMLRNFHGSTHDSL